MREIKFRAWDSHKRKMIFGPTDDNPNSSWILALASLEVPVMQYVGLKDKHGHGKEIYEGDILRGNLPALEGESKDLHLSVVSVHYEECFGQWMVTGQQSLWKWLEGPFNAGGNTYGEVIGNIYENPELLK